MDQHVAALQQLVVASFFKAQELSFLPGGATGCLRCSAALTSCFTEAANPTTCASQASGYVQGCSQASASAAGTAEGRHKLQIKQQGQTPAARSTCGLQKQGPDLLHWLEPETLASLPPACLTRPPLSYSCCACRLMSVPLHGHHVWQPPDWTGRKVPAELAAAGWLYGLQA